MFPLLSFSFSCYNYNNNYNYLDPLRSTSSNVVPLFVTNAALASSVVALNSYNENSYMFLVSVNQSYNLWFNTSTAGRVDATQFLIHHPETGALGDYVYIQGREQVPLSNLSPLGSPPLLLTTPHLRPPPTLPLRANVALSFPSVVSFYRPPSTLSTMCGSPFRKAYGAAKYPARS